MRIDIHSGPQPAAAAESTRPQSAQGRSGQAPLAAQDQAQLSGAHVQALAAQAARMPEIRAEKVQSLREALAGGQYRFEPQKTAGALMAHMRVESGHGR